MASSFNSYNFPYFPSPPQPYFRPPPPAHPVSPPPPPPHVSPPPPVHPISPPPRPPPQPQPINPPPPHVLPPPPPFPPNNNPTVIIIVFVSLGGLLFVACAFAALCCLIKKKKKRAVQDTEIVNIDEHLRIKEAITKGPHKQKNVVLAIEDDVRINEEIRKKESVGDENVHVQSAKITPSSLQEGGSSNSPKRRNFKNDSELDV